LTKWRPFEEWGNVKWEVIVGDIPKDPEPPIPVLNEAGNGGDGNANGGPGVPMRPSSPEPELDYIECPICTYHNPLTATVCEISGTSLK